MLIHKKLYPIQRVRQPWYFTLILWWILPGCSQENQPQPATKDSQPNQTAVTNDQTAKDGAAAADETTAGETLETGSLEGVIYYDSDPARQWRYSRYYIQSRSTGELAEAVVALRNTRLLQQQPYEASEPVIDQRDYRFIPETLAIHVGDRVKFTNADTVLHNVMTRDGIDPFSVNIGTDGSYMHLFRRAGGISRPIRIGCIFHGAMRSWIYVFAHPYFHVTQRDGSFSFQDVPAGEYNFDIVHPAGNLSTNQVVTIRPGETTKLDVRLSPDDLRKGTP